ncbi:MAG: DedA family protein [Cyanobacteria bacterium SZAS LIN-2]|nr:DedA family protein [Cyanobacteria bacterium SZAS LIN-3]MBS1995177.1 DedA family protein [Cyanobacteria bacterium SZAS LIN-2]
MIKDGVAAWGYWAVILMMAIESANIPLPSEAIMPTAGILVQQNKMNIHLAALAGAIGCVLGSIPSYFLGMYGGRPFLAKYGRYFLLREKDMELADKWVEKYGDITFFVCRMLPVVRTFISFPAGVLKAHFGMFVGYTFVGSLIWCYLLTYVGIKFGENMEVFTDIWHKFDLAIVLFCVVGFGYYLYRHLKHD